MHFAVLITALPVGLSYIYIHIQSIYKARNPRRPGLRAARCPGPAAGYQAYNKYKAGFFGKTFHHGVRAKLRRESLTNLTQATRPDPASLFMLFTSQEAPRGALDQLLRNRCYW
jgi:hypothetical protein